MSFIATIDHVEDDDNCQSLIEQINNAGYKNRFSYEWRDHKGNMFPHNGTVSAQMHEQHCSLNLNYDDNEVFIISFHDLIFYTKNKKRKWKWLHGSPEWFKKAEADLKTANNLLALSLVS